MRTMPLLIASVLFSAPAPAQTPQAQTPQAQTAQAAAPTLPNTANGSDQIAKLLAADANKDGKWDLAEWLAAGRRERGFRFLDTNKDGFLTADEIKAGVERLRAMQR
jgi:hypothetical protein